MKITTEQLQPYAATIVEHLVPILAAPAGAMPRSILENRSALTVLAALADHIWTKRISAPPASVVCGCCCACVLGCESSFDARCRRPCHRPVAAYSMLARRMLSGALGTYFCRPRGLSLLMYMRHLIGTAVKHFGWLKTWVDAPAVQSHWAGWPGSAQTSWRPTWAALRVSGVHPCGTSGMM